MSTAAAHPAVDDLRRSGVRTGDHVGLAVDDREGGAIALAYGADGDHVRLLDAPAAPAVLGDVDSVLRPRWVVWSGHSATTLASVGIRLSTCWDLAAVHRLLVGGWRADAGRVWAHAHGLALDDVPASAPPDLFSSLVGDTDLDVPVRPDGHVRPEWYGDGWQWTDGRLEQWARLALVVARRQHHLVESVGGPRMLSTARSESTAELLCAELSVDGLPMDRAAAERIIAEHVGPRPADDTDAAAQRRQRDQRVLRLAPPGTEPDLRNPAHVKSLLRRVGIELPDTRAWRLESLRDVHPIVDALLVWRKAERIATTFGYQWLDEHLGVDGRLRGEWSGSDGAAGRMTASAGLHNMPAVMRPAVAAEPGHVFVRADLGQIEPRVLAAISGDRLLAAATASDDLYAPVAAELGVDRPTAKVAVLGAMYGQTTGRGAQVLRRLESAYPVSMQYLLDADLAGQAGRELRTYGGRLIPMWPGSGAGSGGESDREARSRAAARGRYARNAVVQGAAAELFKVWAVTVRARSAALAARVVLCLHDELLVHTPIGRADEVAGLVVDCLGEAAHRWAPDRSVRFVADVAVVPRWSDAKG
ncbi:MAG: DNA polymerase [Ilumatobacteraceae bacterium]